jgi:3-methyladenine DNA glycosylase/8-oxoguanine DNA glycosylase
MNPSTPPAPPTASTIYRPRHRLDVAFAVMGAKTLSHRSGVNWWATNTPQGPVTVAFRVVDGQVRADTWGPGSDWALEQLPRLLGADDDLDGFAPHHPIVRMLSERFPIPRIGATGRWFEAMATAAIGQRVVRGDAGASRTRLSRRHGSPAPGPSPIPLFPDPATILTITDHEFHAVGIERARARVVRVAAKHTERLERLGREAPADARSWLQKLPGVGPWTTALTTSVAGGDADAVPVGDLHVPRLVCEALGGDSAVDPATADQRMLELLEPYSGPRQRVVRMLKLGGVGKPSHRPAPFRYDISAI